MQIAAAPRNEPASPPPTMTNRRTVTLQLAGLGCSVALAVGLQAHENTDSGASDGYAATRSGTSPACDYRYIELGSDGRTLSLQPRPGAEPDDGAATLALARPFPLFGTNHSALVVSANGYLAAAGSLRDEDGSDFGNDCPLPRKADNRAAVQDRIYVYHDDLRPRRDGGGQVRHAFFPSCPRVAASGRREACTVVEWNGFERSGPLQSTQPLRAQAVLYHGSGASALQFASVDDSGGGSATIGLQGRDARVASTASCNEPEAVRPQQAVCFAGPRGPRLSP